MDLQLQLNSYLATKLPLQQNFAKNLLCKKTMMNLVSDQEIFARVCCRDIAIQLSVQITY
jgi:hypothetical protein